MKDGIAPDHKHSCFLNSTVKVKVYAPLNKTAEGDNLLKVCKDMSYYMLQMNGRIQDNNFEDKCDSILHITKELFKTPAEKREFYTQFGEAYPNKKELGSVLQEKILPCFNEIENLFYKHKPTKKTYEMTPKNLNDIETDDDRLIKFIEKPHVVTLKHGLSKTIAKKDRGGRSPWGDLNLFCTLKVFFMMIVLDKVEVFGKLVSDINLKGVEGNDTGEDKGESVPQLIPKHYDENEAFSNAVVDERFIRK